MTKYNKRKNDSGRKHNNHTDLSNVKEEKAWKHRAITDGMYAFFRPGRVYNKIENLTMYKSNAPFGGNVARLEVSCRRYNSCLLFRRSQVKKVTLAVLTKNPYFPENNLTDYFT